MRALPVEECAVHVERRMERGVGVGVAVACSEPGAVAGRARDSPVKPELIDSEGGAAEPEFAPLSPLGMRVTTKTSMTGCSAVRKCDGPWRRE